MRSAQFVVDKSQSRNETRSRTAPDRMIYSTVGIRGIALTVGRSLNGQDCNVFNVLALRVFSIHLWTRTHTPSLPRFDSSSSLLLQQLVRDISFYLKLEASSRKQQRRFLISDLPIIGSARD